MRIGSQFVKFGLVGVLNTAIQYAVFVGLFRFANVPMVLASGIGYVAGILNSYFLNRVWTFRVQRARTNAEFARFLLVNLLAMGVNLLTLKALVSWVGLVPELAQVGAIFSSLVVNFAGNKLWTFRGDVSETDLIRRGVNVD